MVAIVCAPHLGHVQRLQERIQVASGPLIAQANVFAGGVSILQEPRAVIVQHFLELVL